ncbi:MAG: undecaprenyl/decaprenyl-phosphate alpha-N-acetylglucosaminyl 1-phosphate transferase [Actinomycetota bacterium]|nr:undecaprenyl/decaprenyl-phosphate alpha-N-acetylglucosaminyl 1-phosphate transferase [Actinomycetota bacterium]
MPTRGTVRFSGSDQVVMLWWGGVLGFGVAAATAAFITPLARRAAVRYDVLDRPREGKSHGVPVPYLGGFAILSGVVIGSMIGGAMTVLQGVGVGGLVIAASGFADDLWGLPASFRLALQLTAAAALVASGVQAAPTGSPAIDVILSVLWIVGITNAFNLLDNMNGLSAGVAGVSSFLLFVMATFQGQYAIAALAIGISGACLGFLPYNYPRARIFMGDGGSLPLGFLIAVVSLRIEFPIPPLYGFAAVVCFLAVPVIDTSVVVVDRLVGGRGVARGGTDHVSHRLVGLGLSPVVAVAALLVLTGLSSLVGLVAGRGLVPLHWLTLNVMAAALFGAWMLCVVPARLDRERLGGRAPRALPLSAGGRRIGERR